MIASIDVAYVAVIAILVTWLVAELATHWHAWKMRGAQVSILSKMNETLKNIETGLAPRNDPPPHDLQHTHEMEKKLQDLQTQLEDERQQLKAERRQLADERWKLEGEWTQFEDERQKMEAARQLTAQADPRSAGSQISEVGRGTTQRDAEDPTTIRWQQQSERWRSWAIPQSTIQLAELRPAKIYDMFQTICDDLHLRRLSEREMIENHILSDNLLPIFRAAAFIETYYADESAVSSLRELVMESVRFVTERLQFYNYVPIIPEPLSPLRDDCESSKQPMVTIEDSKVQRKAFAEYKRQSEQGAYPEIVGDIEKIGFRYSDGKPKKKARAKIISWDWDLPDTVR